MPREMVPPHPVIWVVNIMLALAWGGGGPLLNLRNPLRNTCSEHTRLLGSEILSLSHSHLLHPLECSLSCMRHLIRCHSHLRVQRWQGPCVQVELFKTVKWMRHCEFDVGYILLLLYQPCLSLPLWPNNSISCACLKHIWAKKEKISLITSAVDNLKMLEVHSYSQYIHC